MYIPAWQIAAWSDVIMSVAEWNASVSHLKHLGTSEYEYDEQRGLWCGQALWGRDAANDLIGVAWDWKEVRPGVVAMSDPMTVLSNAILIGEDGSRVNPFKRLLHLNDAIFLLPWQGTVRARHRDARLAA